MITKRSPPPGDRHRAGGAGGTGAVMDAADALNRHFASVGSRIAEELGDAIAAGHDRRQSAASHSLFCNLPAAAVDAP